MVRTGRNLLAAAIAVGLLGVGIAAATPVDVLTYHNDLARTGQNLFETVLTPATVSPSTFGRVFTRIVDGFVYAQPLIVTGLDIPGKGTFDVVFVATENDTVYAFDASGAVTRALWRRRLIVPRSGGRAVTWREVGCDDLVPKIGVTSTPVIDRASGTLYVVAKTKERGKGNFVQRLHALDLATGAEKLGGPVAITASVPGSGDGSVGGMIAFDPLRQHQRAALALVNGVVYIGSAAHCDIGPYHGWIIGYDASTLSRVSAFATTPDGGLGGVWQSGGAPAADDAGNLYVATGNGTFDAQDGGSDYGNSLLKLQTTGGLSVVDYFTPFNQSDLDAADQDFGSTGPLLLPDQPGSHPHLALASGKDGTIYVVDRDQMGQFHAGSDSQIVQSLPGAIAEGTFPMPAYWNGTVFYSGRADFVKAFALSSGLLSTTPVAQSGDFFGFPGASMSVSANDATGGIVWAIQTDGYANRQPAVLHAYAAADISQTLYASDQTRRDAAGSAVKFAVPTVANGKVYVGGQHRLTAYGLR